MDDNDLTQPVWFVARLANKNMGYFEAVPVGKDPASGFIEYRITIDDEIFVVAHNPEKPIWSLLYRALEASLYGSDDDLEEFPEL